MVAIKNTQQKAKDAVVAYKAGGNVVKLSFGIVRNYLVSGDSAKVSDQEIAMFINLCKAKGLNPWEREAYLIKYGSSPATLVVGKEAYMKRAEDCPNFDGFKAGIIVNSDGGYEYREGCFTAAGESVAGGWAEVYRKDRTYPVRAEISLQEYAGRKAGGEMNGQWASKPGTMARKVALVQALREAFPAKLGNMYTAEEQGTEEPAVADFNPSPDIIDAEAQPTLSTPAPTPAGFPDDFDDGGII